MINDRRPSRRIVAAAQSTALGVAVSAVLLMVPAEARATVVNCTAPMAAATLQSKTPFHATYVVAAKTPGAFPTEHHEEIWVGNKMYTLLADKRWQSTTVAQNPMRGFTGPISGFSDCQSVAAASIRGESATGDDVKMESGRRVKMWISPKSGLPMREIVDQDILLATLDFDYANVSAPR